MDAISNTTINTGARWMVMLVVTMLSIPTTFAERTLYCNEQGIGELRDDGELANLGEDAFILKVRGDWKTVQTNSLAKTDLFCSQMHPGSKPNLIRCRDRDRTLLIDKQTLRYVLSRISAVGWIYPGDDSVGRISFGSCKEFG
ncbi:MAG: hypothetical protein VW645_01470 [Betaproteobacteria bacterium]